MDNVVFGILGIQLDRPRRRESRWAYWRPTVATCQQPDFLVHRYELLYESKHHTLAKQVADDIAQVSPDTVVNLQRLDIDDPWDFGEVYSTLSDVARGYTFRTRKESYFFNITTGTHVAQICGFLLTESRHFPAKLLQSSPPLGRNKDVAGTLSIIDLDLSRYDAIAARFALEATEGTAFLKSGIETRSPAFNALIDRIEQVAVRSPEPILITGPTGAGKSRLAERIHALKHQRNVVTGPFVAANCATLRGDAAMSALFGHVKGAFTGAQTARDGYLATANNGVLFLDEIGELGGDEQAMLLRALEEKRFFPLGSDVERTSDFQLIAGTNRDLSSRVASGEFREDLLARINLWTFDLPALRDRREDIEPNIDFELEQFERRTSRRVRFNAEARQRFLDFAHLPSSTWNANFRDLSAAITRMATLADSGRINEALVDEEIVRLVDSWAVGQGETMLDPALARLIPEAIDRFDRSQLTDVLQVCSSAASLSDAGRTLFAISREKRKSSNDADRLGKYLAKFGLRWSDIQER